MATSIPFPFSTPIPVTPPPDHPSFSTKGPVSPQLLKTFAQDVYGAMGSKLQDPARSIPNIKGKSPADPESSKPNDPSSDPRYIAMASRIASYYQQRCQAVANYQQQRCQAWATMHRQKCQEMMQAAMLVVAWYIRDRISRRRKRQRRQFKRGLSVKSVRSKITKGETVRRWVMDVPANMLSPTSPPRSEMADKEEAEFSMDKETTPDKDAKLFNVADNLIKSQLTKIDVPLLGALSFDESDSESEDEEIREWEQDDEEEEDLEEGDEEMVEDDDEYYEEEDDDDEEYEEVGSEEVQMGTGRGSGKETSCAS